ncbi:MAG: Ig-like domain-containing protein [Methanobacterium sp.]
MLLLTLAFSISISGVSAVDTNSDATISNTQNYDNTQDSPPDPLDQSTGNQVNTVSSDTTTVKTANSQNPPIQQSDESKTTTTSSSSNTPKTNTNSVSNSDNNLATTSSSSTTPQSTNTENSVTTNSISTLAATNNVSQIPEIVITFDDGAESVYTNAYPIMKQYGIKGTVFVNPAYIGTGDNWYMTLAQLQELHNAGWTIANHAYEHLDLTTLSRAAKVTQIQNGINWLNNNGFADGAYYFASPYGAYNQELLDVLSQLGVRIHRTCDEGYITNPPANLLQLPDKEINGINGYHTLDQAKSIVNGATSTNTTAFILLHEIITGTPDNWQWTLSNFNGLIQYISQTGVKTLTVNEWYNEVTGNPIIDTTAPNVTGVDPANNSLNVAVNKIIKITFSEAIKLGSAYNNITITDNNGITITGVTKTISNNVLTLTNNVNYALGTKYNVNLPANSITDLTGNNITAFTSSFTTIQDTVPPSITTTDPANNAINVAVNKIITITFNEPIKAGAAYNNITIANNGAIVSGITKSIVNNVLTLTNSANYASGTNYIINLPANSITDLAGNNITAFTSNFTTINTIIPTITSKIVITFDDGAESIYANAYPIMKQYGIKGTVFINTAYIGQPWYMTLAELQELHNAGWTIASHANEHVDLTTLSRAAKITQLQTAINWLKNNGFADGAYYFASPNGAYNQELLDVCRELGIVIHRTTNEGYVTNPPANLLLLPDKEINGITGYHTLDQAKSIVDGAISTNTTAITLLHEIVTSNPNNWQWTLSNFSGWIQYISQIGVKTLTVNEWYQELVGNDKTAPTVTSIDPVNGSTNIAANKVIQITFSEPIKAGSTYNSITITNNGTLVSSLTKSISGNVLILTNSANYALGTKYTINLPANSITDLAGNNITAFTSNFTTILDNIAPIASANVKTGTYNVDKLVTLTMNEAGTIYYTLNGTTPTKASLIYTGPITISSNTTLKFIAYDLASNPSPVYTETYTIDKTAPIVVSTTPKNGATGVSRGSNIIIQFSENIKSSTNWSQIYVKNMKTGNILSISKSISGKTLTISTNWRAANTLFQVYIPAGAIKDNVGNNCTAYTFNFTTGL